MKYQLILCATALMLGVVQPAMADITLQLPKNIEVLTVNGKSSANTDKLTLANGVNQISFRYITQYRQQAHLVHYQSDVLIIRFDGSEQTLTLKLPTINSARDAKKFDDSPKLTLLNAQDKAVNFTSDKLIKNGIQLGRNYEHEILQYNLREHPASLNITMNAATTQSNNALSSGAVNQQQIPTVIAPIITVNDNASHSTPSQVEITKMLDYWYQLADDNTKANFKTKINQE